ncbi:MAG TPA: preprotein translocase subunit SecG [Paenalcaligenes sp.]|nr:preprotein translocase subunit SecG [Paenalcaligenes sp.]
MLTLSSILQAIQVISSLAIIALVLLQQGKGADMGSAFGGGSAGSMFGSAGAANFLSRMTKWAAVVFFVSTGALAWVAFKPAAGEAGGVMQGFESVVPGVNVPAPTVPQAPDVSVPSVQPSATNEVPAAVVPQVDSVPAEQAEQPEQTEPSVGDSSGAAAPVDATEDTTAAEGETQQGAQ